MNLYFVLRWLVSHMKELYLSLNNLKSSTPCSGARAALHVSNLEPERRSSFRKHTKELENLLKRKIPKELELLLDLRLWILKLPVIQIWKTLNRNFSTKTLFGTIFRSPTNCTMLRYLEFDWNNYLDGSISKNIGNLSNRSIYVLRKITS